MSRGKRYDNEPKLNIKKVIAVIVAIAVIVMFVIAIRSLIKSDSSSSRLISTTYFLINKNNKWGVIDNNSKIIIEPTYEEAIIIPNNKKDIFICNYDVNYENNTYQVKVLNAKGKEIFQEYDTVNALENYDENKNLWYEDNVLLVQKDGKYGLINYNGDVILDINYEEITTLKGIKNSLVTLQKGAYGLVNNQGKVIIENQYEEIKSLGEDVKNYIIKKDDKYGVNDILECKYEEIEPLNNKEYFLVKESKENKVINKDGEKVFSEKFDSIESIENNIIIYTYKKKYYAYNIKDKKKLESSYDELSYTNNDLFIAKSGNNYGIIDIENTTKVDSKYSKINYYKDAGLYELEEKDSDSNKILNNQLEEIAQGMVNEVNAEKSYIKVWTENGYEYYNLNGEKKESKDVLLQNNLFLIKQNGKYGYANKNGEIVVDCIYDDATEQNEFGYSAIKKDGLWGSIDKNGNIICETKYNLENNLLVDFIGEYHLGADINLMYYTDKI